MVPPAWLGRFAWSAAICVVLGAAVACDGGGVGPTASGPGLEPPVEGVPGAVPTMGGTATTPAGAANEQSRGDAGLDSDGSVLDSPDAAPAREPVPAAEARGCITDVSAGEHTFPCDGISHDLSVPEDCLEWACGLVIDVHGGTMSARMENKNTNLKALGREHGYVVVQPSAFGGLWNAAVDDAKVFAFANDVIAAFHLDANRVHMTGFSQGGYMTWRFVCQHTDWLASAAPAAAAGTAAISIETGCAFTGSDVPTGEIPLLYMHGKRDALVAFQNATTLREAVRTVYEATDEQVVSMDAGHVRTRYSNARGVPFEFIEHDYASASAVGIPPLGVAIVGHCYPGSDDFTPTEPGQLMAFGCEPPTAFHWGEQVIAFFLAHPR